MRITGIRPHPEDSNLEIAFVRAQCVVPKGMFKINELVCIAQVISEVKGVHCDGILASKENV